MVVWSSLHWTILVLFWVFFIQWSIAAVSCSSTGCRLGGVKLGSGSTGKLGRAWVGAWHILLGLVRLDLGIGGGLV